MGTLNVGLGFLRKLPRILIRCAELTLDAVALQEIGDPALLSTRLPSYQLVCAAGPSAHEAGVGMLLSLALAPRIRRYFRSDSGRLVGAVLELSPGRTVLLVSAYMPSGLDHSAPDSPSHRLAHSLYAELMGWSVGVAQVVVMGDLNETLTRWDRQPSPPAPSALAAAACALASPLAALQQDGYTDVYRHLHPSPELSPGFTHVIEGLRPSRSRLDYIWSKGFSAADLSSQVDPALCALSHHRLLWAEMRPSHAPPSRCTTPLLQMRLPNLRAATEVHKSKFAAHLERGVLLRQAELLSFALDDSLHSLHRLAAELTQLVHRSAFACFPITGSPPHSSASLLQLSTQRRDLSRLLHTAEAVYLAAPAAMGDCLSRCPRWLQQYTACTRQHGLQWRSDAWYGGDPRAWIAETRQMLGSTRASIRAERQRMMRERRAPVEASPAALVHRMLKSDALPSHLHSVVDAHGALTSTSAQLQEVMVDHFREVFAVPPPSAVPLPHPPPAMLIDKDSVQAEWFDSLMADMSQEEIVATLASAPLVSAPGEDEVSTGLWKLALAGCSPLCSLVSQLFSACLRTSTFPSAWKTSVIVPLIKNERAERTMSNVRPISLQSCLGKLFNQLLAMRLGTILARFPILHPAQRGFILGGSTSKCIDELLDSWDWSRGAGEGPGGADAPRELYALFYDIKQAYDSVQTDVIKRALQRLRMPPAFVALIQASLTGLTSRIRTAYGLSASFPVQRSLRQGDPLAPLLFVILMDALHEGLERNPFTGQQHGLVMQLGAHDSASLPSLGFADDTAVLANTLANLRVQNEWVHYFMRFNCMRLNHAKCELVGRDAAGGPVTAAALAAAGISIEGNPLTPVAHEKAIRYLGVHCCFDGGWHAQRMRTLGMLQLFTRVVSKFRVSLSQATYMFNAFLQPKLELALRYVHGPGTTTWLKGCDRTLVGCIKHAVASPLSLSHSAVALSLHFSLPSWLETSIKVAELFLRINSTECRWGRLGRMLLHRQLPARVIDSTVTLPRGDKGNRITRAIMLAVRELGWSLQVWTEKHGRAPRIAHLLRGQPAGALPDLTVSSGSDTLQLHVAAAPLPVVHDLWRGWGTSVAAPAQPVHIYTDGSHNNSTPVPSSSWAVTVGDRWLHDNFALVPADEEELAAQPAHAGGAALFGGSIAATRGVYPAELQAIARTLAMFPTSCPLHIHSDSQAAIAGIRAYECQTNERQRLLTAARPLLQLIHHLLSVRERAGSTLTLQHVKAHTRHTDMHSVGNRLSDFQANRARLKPLQPQPLCLLELPLQQCEHYVSMWRPSPEAGPPLMIIDDIRRAAMSQLKAAALTRHSRVAEKPESTSYIIGAGSLELGSIVLSHGSPSLQHAHVHVATNSIHHLWVPTGRADRSHTVQCLTCAPCTAAHTPPPPLTLQHLVACPRRAATAFRARLRASITAGLATSPCTAAWFRSNGRKELGAMLLSLFPIAAGTSLAGQQLHSSRLLCGAFTRRQARAAGRSLGFATAEDGLPPLIKLRMQCLEHCNTFFSHRKERAIAAAP